MIKEAIGKVSQKIDLSENEMRSVFEDIMSGNATYSQIGAFITALRMKGETVDEIVGAAQVMREKSLKIRIKDNLVDLDREDINIDKETMMDTCGTGGSGTNTFNISTTVAFIVAACGVKVAKHGNRAMSSLCGSADVLERLGINLDVSAEKVEECLRDIGIGFLFAPLFHQAMKYAIIPRKEIGIRTIFNILGPLCNPAGAKRQVLGVYKKGLVPLLAQVLKRLGSLKALVVHGLDTLDEITITGKTKVAELKDDKIKVYYIDPKVFGFKRATIDQIRGGSVDENASIILDILKGVRSAKRDIALMNASAALVVSDKATGFKDGIKKAAEAIDSGKALEKLERLRELTNAS